MKKKYKIKKNDFLRPLLTEVLPYETPLSFSNLGFYNTIKVILNNLKDSTNERFLEYLGLTKPDILLGEEYDADIYKKNYRDKTPLIYSIKRGNGNKRFLAIPHPVSQLLVCLFYSSYSQSLVYFCSKSSFSLRFPYKVATSYYAFSGSKDFSRFKTEVSVQDLNEDSQRYAASYFAYRPYTRLFHYINSEDFFETELKFRFLRKLDISNCFDNIYTHAISWATKNKESAKKSRNVRGFGNEFDKLMRSSNSGETFGIIIGPEVSRIFAEIILQSIDLKILKRLKALGFSPEDYSIKRYVDDYFIYTHTEESSLIVKSVLIETCKEYKLNLNTQKETFLKSPFATTETAAIERARIVLKYFYSSFLKKDNDKKTIHPKKIWAIENLVHSFGNKVKSITKELNVDISKISSFLIGSLCQKIIVLVRNKKLTSTDLPDYEAALEVLLRSVFYVYELSPNVSASFNVSLSVTLSVRFLARKKKNELYKQKMNFLVFSLISSFLKNQLNLNKSKQDNDESLETINLLITLKEVKPFFSLSDNLILDYYKNFKKGGTKDYFLLTSILFYIEKDKQYQDIKLSLIKEINKTFDNWEKLSGDEEAKLKLSEDCQQLLYVFDLLACPFIPAKKREEWSNKIFPVAEKEYFHNIIKKNTWFTNWKETDLLNLLEKKRKQIVY